MSMWKSKWCVAVTTIGFLVNPLWAGIDLVATFNPPATTPADNPYWFRASSLNTKYLAMGVYSPTYALRSRVAIFERSATNPSVWNAAPLITSENTFQVDDDFGASTAVTSEGRLIVGAPSTSTQASGSFGAAYLFERQPDSTWRQTNRFAAADLSNGDNFGAGVGADGDYAIVGAPGQYGTNEYYNGSAYIYERNRGGLNQWGMVQKIDVPGDGWFAQFGARVSVSGNRAAVSAPTGYSAQGVYIFERSSSGAWTSTARLSSPDGHQTLYGTSIDLDGDTLIVSDQYETNSFYQEGEALIFRRSNSGTWALSKRLRPTAPKAEGFFGSAVSLSGEYAVVTPSLENYEAQGVLVYGRNVGGIENWGLVAKLVQPGNDFRAFGIAPQISNGVIATFSTGVTTHQQTGMIHAIDELSSPGLASVIMDGLAPDQPSTLLDSIVVENRGGAGSAINITGYQLLGASAEFFGLPDFELQELIAGSGDASRVVFDLEFFGARPGIYQCSLLLLTDSGSLGYDVRASVVPEPSTTCLFTFSTLAVRFVKRRRR